MIDTSAIQLAIRPSTSPIRQWWVLTLRVITPTLRNGEVFTQAAAPVMFTVGFYIPLKQFMGTTNPEMGSYAQYLMPLIALTARSLSRPPLANCSPTGSTGRSSS